MDYDFTNSRRLILSLADKVFRIALILTLVFQNIAWTMDHPSSSANEDTPLLSVTKMTVSKPEGSGIEDDKPLKSHSDLSLRFQGPGLDLQKDSNVFDETFIKQKLENLENSWWRIFCWAGLDNLFQRVGYSFTVGVDEIVHADDQKKCCSHPVWFSGGSFPIASKRARNRVLFIDGLRHGAEFVIFRTIHTGITALAIYQLYQYLDQATTSLPCQLPVAKHSVGGLIKFWENSDSRVLLGLFHTMLGSDQSGILPYLKYLLATPFVYGFGRGLWNTRQNSLESEEIDILLQTVNDVPPGFYMDTVRWLFPLHPINRNLSTLVRNVLWNPNVSLEDLQKIQNCLEDLVHRQGYTPIHALAYVMQIVYGVNIKDVRTFRQNIKTEDSDDIPLGNMGEMSENVDFLDHRIHLKARAFSLLQEAASFNKTGSKKTFWTKVNNRIAATYAQYLLWSLGAPRSLCETALPSIFKIGKLYIQAKLIQTIADAFLQAQKCPKKPGVSLAGVEPWASDLTQECFEASMRSFNTIPGQPTDTLVGDLGQYYFPNCTIDLDLSGRDASGAVIANITRALNEHNITFSSLNLSGNTINTPGDFEAIYPFLMDITHLDLSNNFIGAEDSNGIIAFAEGFSALKKLISLDISENMIGSTDSKGAVVLGQQLAILSNLTYLDLSENYIDVTGSQGMSAIGRTLPSLGELLYLNLSNNALGVSDSNGTITLSQGLSSLTRLTSFDISINSIGFTDSQGEVALGKAILYLRQVNHIDLSRNGIGYIDSQGLKSISTGLSQLSCLVSLGFSKNFIGYTDSQGSTAIGDGLSNLTQLSFLDISGNYIASDSLGSFIQSFYGLRKLRNLIFLPNSIANSDILRINNALNHTLAPPLPSIIASVSDAYDFCQSFPSSAESCDLSARIPSPAASTLAVLLECLRQKKQLISLKLSDNNIGWGNSSSTIALGQGLSDFTQLTLLDISNNYLGASDSWGVAALGQGLSSLRQLRFLDLSINDIGFTDSNGTIVLSNGISNLTQLKYLDLSANRLGLRNSDGVVELGKALSELKQLTFFELSVNPIEYVDSKGSTAIGSGLSGLTNLSFLDLSYTLMSTQGSSGGMAVGQGLANMDQLTFLDLSLNSIGYTNSQDVVEISKSLSGLTSLVMIDLSNNKIGYADSLGSIELSKGLAKASNLESINLGGNQIGSTGAEGPAALIPVLLSLPKLKLENLNVQDMANISWSQAASYLENRQSQAMITACQVSQCFGGDIHANTANTQGLDTPSYSFAQNTTVAPESRALVVYDESISASVESDILSTLGMSALYGAAFAALPEALGDVLHLSGMVSERNAHHVKIAANTGLVLATGSWLPVGASMATTAVLQRLGISESKARLAGNTAAFLVNAGRVFTPAGIVGGAINYAAARLGFWAEKRVFKRFSSAGSLD